MSLRHFLGFCGYVWPDFLRKWLMARNAGHSEAFYREWMPKWAQGVCRAAGVDIHVTGLDRIGPGPYLVAPNHQGYLDVPALMGSLPGRPRFVMKRELLKWPFFGRMLFHSGMIAINRADRHQAIAAIEDALRKTKPGDMVYMFPEGTRTRDGYLGKVKRGIFYFAANSGLPILPVAIRGSFDRLPKSSYREMNPGPIYLDVLPPIEIPADRGEATVDELQKTWEREIRLALGEPVSLPTGQPA